MVGVKGNPPRKQAYHQRKMFKCNVDMWTLHSTQQRLQDASLVQHEPSIQTRCHKQHQYLWSWCATALHNAGKIEGSKKSSPAAKRPAVCKRCVKRFRLRLDSKEISKSLEISPRRIFVSGQFKRCFWR